ncbi:MAG TPA: hypothetical protein VGB42_10880, partial [Candidatus Thermoplasmatota archaeon]
MGAHTFGLPAVLAAALSVATFPLFSAPLQAQIGVDVVPRVGWVDPGGDLFDVERALSGTPWGRERTSAAISPSPALGLAVEVGDRDVGWGLRLGVATSIDAETTVDALGMRTDGFFPFEHDHFLLEHATRLTSGAIEVVMPLLFRVGPVRPYLSAGLGLKHYAFGSPSSCTHT